MLNDAKLARVFEKLDADQMLITDPFSIYYLTGKMIQPMERFYGLFISRGKKPVMFVNELSRFEEDIGVEKVYITDTTDIPELLRPYVDCEKSFAVDKILPARFLIPMMDKNLAKDYKIGSPAVDYTRAVKDEDEIERMRQSSLVNDEAMGQMKLLIHDGVTELEVAEEIGEIYRRLGAEDHAFYPIVAFGDNAADPHHSPDNTVIKEGDIVLFDVGCTYRGYCSDMTRTFFYKKYPDAEAERVYNLVRRANEEAEAMIKPGVPICDVDKKARDIITEGGYGPDFTHRLGHFIGLETHEFGDVSSANTRVEEAGNIHSVEPGIYHPGIAGVRIEDLVLTTPDGHEVLNHYPKDIEVIGN